MKMGKINNLSWYARLGIFGAVAILFYAAFWYFVTSGTRKDTKNLQDQIATLKKANAEMQIVSQRLNEFRTTYKNKQEELEELKALLPEQRELTNVLQGIQDHARATGLSLRHFTPDKDDVQQDFYSGKKIDVSVQSSFGSLRAFFDQMAHYQRIVSITNFELKQLDNQSANKTVEARFDLTAYYVSAEKLQKAAEKPGAQPNNAAPAQGQAPANPAAATQQAVQQAASGATK